MTLMSSGSNKVNIIVPVYDDWRSLEGNITSLKKYYSNDSSVNVYYVNDCGPRANILEEKIKNSIANIRNLHYVRNKKNLGFVKNCNNAVFNLVKDKKADILLLNSDTAITAGFKEEMVNILYSGDDICAVSPRGNNATVWSVPMDGSLINKPRKSYRQWLKLKEQIPDKYISPTVHGFCMLIRRAVIDEIGLFDEIYGRGYGEENDFTMRARDNGWKCAIANHAFVFHYGSRSFGNKDRDILSSKNSKILLNRYPNYNTLVAQYMRQHIEPRVIRSHGKIYKSFRLAVSAVEYGYVNGYMSILRKALSIAQNRLDSPKLDTTNPKIQIWTHEISKSGAPLVLFDIIRQWQKTDDFQRRNITFNYPHGVRVDYDLHQRLADEGVDFRSVHVIEARFTLGDIVILNSTSQPPQLYEKILDHLHKGIIKHLYFYIHEDDEHTTGATDKYRRSIGQLVKDGQITIYAPSSNSVKNWKNYFDVDVNIFSMPGHVSFHKDMFKEKIEKDFEDIDFIIAGSREPRKGILNVIHALITVERYHIQRDPGQYRNFTLTIVGNDHKCDFYNRFIKNESSYFKDRVKLIGDTSQENLYDIIKKSNLTVTYSIADSLSMVSFEGMAFGHPIIRSEASGQEEQLIEGGNGWLTHTTNWIELVDAIEEVLNKKKTPSSKLSKMSAESVRIAKDNYTSNYRILDDIRRDLP